VAWQEAEPIKLRIECPSGGRIGIRKPIPLSAQAVDVDELVAECSDSEGGTQITVIPLPDKVRFEWTLGVELLFGRSAAGVPGSPPIPYPGPVPGTLVGPGGVSGPHMEGDQVLYRPPYIHCGESVYVVIGCTARNTPRGKIMDAPRVGEVILMLQRTQGAPHQYIVTVISKTQDDLAADFAEQVSGYGLCALTGAWDSARPIDEDEHARAFPKEICPGELAVLRVRGYDSDRLTLTCGGSQTLRLDDPVTGTWTASAGTWPCGGEGEVVVYKAPPTPGNVTITCVLRDSGRQAPDAPVTVTFPIKIGWDELLARSRALTDRLKTLEQTWQAAADPRYKFVANHTCISEGIMAAVAAGRFKDPCWMLRLNIAFILKFLDALDAYEGNRPTQPDWRRIFEFVESLKSHPVVPAAGSSPAADTADYVTVWMAGVHIFNDIAQSLMEEGCGPEEDFLAVMQIIDACEGQHLGILKPIKGVGVLIHAPGANFISDWRNAVWNYICNCGPHPTAGH
jgi:hypothetical protein